MAIIINLAEARIARAHARKTIGSTAATLRALESEKAAELAIGAVSPEVQSAIDSIYNGGYAHEW